MQVSGMVRLWDFATCSCGAGHSDWPIDSPKVPETIKCDCGKSVGWSRGKRNGLHRSLSSLYDRVDPQTGRKHGSYEEKKKWLKETGRVETGIERIDDIMNEEIPKSNTQRDPNMLVADSMEELTETINKVGYDRQKTGSLTGREGQDKETGLIDTWREF
jgi:hypothetical protein